MGSGQIGFDIGAHRGYWTLLYQKRVLPGGIIFAWEPDPKNYQMLLVNLAKKAFVYDSASAGGLARKHSPLSIQGLRRRDRLFSPKVQMGENGHTLAVSVDSLVESLSLPRLDWIKIDIEGAEVEALKGAMKTLSRYKPTLWIAFRDTLEELKRVLAEADYEIRGEVHHAPTPHYREVGYLWAVAKDSAP
jgi:FkbM family methyltransferase